MSEGRGSAFSAMDMVTMVSLLCLLLLAEHANAKTYIINWTFNIKDWPQGKGFKKRDVLRFLYTQGMHNVIMVDQNGYNSCKTTVGSKWFTSGNVGIRLRKGMNYFICNFPGHCEGGMKIAIYAK